MKIKNVKFFCLVWWLMQEMFKNIEFKSDWNENAPHELIIYARTCWTVFITFAVEVAQVACCYHFIKVLESSINVFLIVLSNCQAWKTLLHSTPFFVKFAVLKLLQLNLKSRIGICDFPSNSNNSKSFAPVKVGNWHDVCDADSYWPWHSRKAMNQNIAVSSQSCSMNKIVTNWEELRQVLIRSIRCHHTEIMLFWKQVFWVVMNGQNVCYFVHL